MPLIEPLAVMLPFLRGARSVQFLIATGWHDLDSKGNRRMIESIHTMLEDFDFPEYDIHASDGEKDDFIDIGLTRRGTPVRVNERSALCEVFLVITEMRNHAVAGYSTPLMNFLPGICSTETITQHEALALDERSTFGAHPFHPDSRRRNNPLSEDVWEAVQMILRRRPVLALAVTTNHNRLQWAKVGALTETITAGIKIVDATASSSLPPADFMIVSPGGYPEDESFHAAIHALVLAKNGVKAGGELLLLAACESSVGLQKRNSDFYDLLTQPLAEASRRIEAQYSLGSYKAHQLIQMLQRLAAIHVHSGLPNEIIERARMLACDAPQQVVSKWLASQPEAKINVFDDARRLAIYPPIDLA